MQNVEIYSTPTCHYCHLAKDFLMQHNIAYIEHDVSVNLKKRQEMVEKSGQMGVPVISVNGDFMVGFNEEAMAKALGI